VAREFAAQGGRRINEVRNARMGIMQIDPLPSWSVSGEGNSDTTSVEKTIVATFAATFTTGHLSTNLTTTGCWDSVDRSSHRANSFPPP
jgi:hypothetical protein